MIICVKHPLAYHVSPSSVMLMVYWILNEVRQKEMKRAGEMT
ncbi:hypothetical protein Hanom_Chr06g00560931 [Helianthus anomalus]